MGARREGSDKERGLEERRIRRGGGQWGVSVSNYRRYPANNPLLQTIRNNYQKEAHDYEMCGEGNRDTLNILGTNRAGPPPRRVARRARSHGCEILPRCQKTA